MISTELKTTFEKYINQYLMCRGNIEWTEIGNRPAFVVSDGFLGTGSPVVILDWGFLVEETQEWFETLEETLCEVNRLRLMSA